MSYRDRISDWKPNQCPVVHFFSDGREGTPFMRCALPPGHIGDHRSCRGDWARAELCQGPYPRRSCDCDACEGARTVERELGVKL